MKLIVAIGDHLAKARRTGALATYRSARRRLLREAKSARTAWCWHEARVIQQELAALRKEFHVHRR